MMVRCGACRTEFDAPGEGRHACPTCGAMNQVSSAPQGSDQPVPPAAPPADAQPSAPSSAPPAAAPSPEAPGLEGLAPEPGTQPQAPAPLNEVQCSECQFEFIVGDIEVVSCPNCGTEVRV